MMFTRTATRYDGAALRMRYYVTDVITYYAAVCRRDDG